MNPRWLLVIGTGVMVLAGTLLLVTARLDVPLWWMAIVCGLLGLPNGFNNLGNQLLLHHSVPADSAGAATGIYRTAQYIGASLSAVMVAHLVGPDHPIGGIQGLGTAIASIGAVLLILSIVALVRRRENA